MAPKEGLNRKKTLMGEPREPAAQSSLVKGERGKKPESVGLQPVGRVDPEARIPDAQLKRRGVVNG